MPSISLSGQSKQRQVVILAVGGLILAGLLAFQLPRTLKALRGAESAPAPATEQPTPPPVTPGVPPSPAVPVATTPSVSAASLTRFRSKDPFVQQINPNPSSGATESSATGTSAPSSAQPADESSAFRAIGSASRGSAGKGNATIAVNGAEEIVSVAKTFPKANPVFKLVSVGNGTAKVGIATGTLKGGSQTVTLMKGEPLTLLNTVDGKRYKLELVSASS
jgi:hypothetical protein